jgi:hypothetical protein
MKNLFVPYEIASLLKDKNFDSPCTKFKNNISNITEEKVWFNWNEVDKFVSLPLYQQVIDWFRGKHKIDVRVYPRYTRDDSYTTCWGWNVLELEWGEDREHHIAAAHKAFDELSYYEAYNEAIRAAIKILP